MNTFRKLQVFAAQADRRTVQFVLMIISIALFVLGAGAPEGEGGVALRCLR